MRNWFLTLGKTFEAPAVHKKNIEPVVVVVIVERDAAARGLEQIFILVFPAEDSFDVEAGFAGDVEEADADFLRRRGIGICVGRRSLLRIRGGRLAESFQRPDRIVVRTQRTRESEDAFDWQDQRGTAERFKKGATRGRQMEWYLPGICSC